MSGAVAGASIPRLGAIHGGQALARRTPGQRGRALQPFGEDGAGGPVFGLQTPEGVARGAAGPFEARLSALDGAHGVGPVEQDDQVQAFGRPRGSRLEHGSGVSQDEAGQEAAARRHQQPIAQARARQGFGIDAPQQAQVAEGKPPGLPAGEQVEQERQRRRRQRPEDTRAREAPLRALPRNRFKTRSQGVSV